MDSFLKFVNRDILSKYADPIIIRLISSYNYCSKNEMTKNNKFQNLTLNRLNSSKTSERKKESRKKYIDNNYHAIFCNIIQVIKKKFF